ncbi:MAG TPA: glycosyltransferase family 2 protein [Pseudoxanthomonas sp.]
MNPILSVVIPTHRRAKLVTRAIASVADVHAGTDVEILVVPNGNDETWKTIAERHSHDPRIRWLYLPAGNASAARNHGLSNAQGKYLRFLDDDDYLLPAAADQLRLIERQDLDVCSAPLENTSTDGSRREALRLPDTSDFVAAAIQSARISLTQGSVFKREFILKNRWRENVDLYDDYLWMLDLAASAEAAWASMPIPVCAYVQHHGDRLSRVRRSGANSRLLVEALLQLHHLLERKGRLTPERNVAVATALLTQAHSSFPASPLFLGATIRRATAIAPDARPLQPVFDAYPWLARHLLAVEWTALAPRYLSRGCRRATWSVGRMLERLEKSASARSGANDP